MRNKLFDLSVYVGRKYALTLYERLYDACTSNDIANTVDEVLKDYYHDWFCERPVQKVLDHILKSKGLLNVRDLLEKFPYSERTLDRIFAREVGVSPHGFITLVRFNYMIREVEEGKYKTLSELVSKYDYYDHSHFEKDFKRFLGQSIKEYKNTFNPLLTNSLKRLYHADGNTSLSIYT
jgi:AraC-like DNA-binding protein